ncbi:4835_t:CDS:1, partial [Gigaspora margarita]
SKLKLEGEKKKKKDKTTFLISLIGPLKDKIRKKTGYLDNAI